MSGRAVTAIGRWWFADAPAERLATMRILVGTYASVSFGSQLGELGRLAHLPASQFDAVGPARLVDAPLPVALVLAIAVAGVALAVAFTLGVRYRIVAPLTALVALWVAAYRSSWGMVFHTENLVVLHLLALALAPAADVWALGPRPRRDRAAGYGWPLRLVAALTAATYVVAGIAKLRLGGSGWLGGALLRDEVAIDNLRKALLGESVAPLATPLLAHPNAVIGLAVVTLVIELGAPILVVGELLGRSGLRLARLWCVGAWAFHLGVVLAMNVWFLYPLAIVPFLVVFRPERGFAWLVRGRGM